MKTLLGALFFFGSSLLLAAPKANPCGIGRNYFNCVEYVATVDADTIKVNIANVPSLFGKSIKVRVKGIDTPELRSKNVCEKTRALKAKLFVEQEVSKAKRIDLRDVERDKYFRILAKVDLDGRSLEEILLKSGYALRYDGRKKPRHDSNCSQPL